MKIPPSAQRKLSIGFVFDDSLDKPDGVQQYILILGRWLSAEGHQVHYLVGETLRHDLPNLHSFSRNIKVRFNQNRMAIPLFTRLKPIRELLASEQFDILHVQVPYSPILAGRIINAADLKTAVIGTFHVAPHSKLVTIGNRALRLAVRNSLRRFDAMLSTSEASRGFAKQTFNIDSTVLPLPLKLDQFYNARPFARYKKGRTVLFLGRLVERKGCRYLLQAVAMAQSDGLWPRDARVIICGGGPLEAELTRFVREQGLDQIVTFTGFISEEDKPRYLAGADVAIFPSTGGESFGIVLLEAMAAARGVVLGGNNPGYATVLAPHPESLFDPLNTPVLARKLVEVLENDVIGEARKWQREYVRQFDVAHVGGRVLQIYYKTLQIKSRT